MLSNTNISKKSPIGIFDSGIGGLSVAAELARLLPSERFIYVGDTANFPYGTRKVEDIQKIVLSIGEWLESQGCKLVIIACNTATAAGLKQAQNKLSIPVIGVLNPGARTAINFSNTNNIGILATDACVKSKAYTDAIHKLNKSANVIEVAAQKLVDIAENKLTACVLYNEEDYDTLFPESTKQELDMYTKLYCKEFIDAECDTVVLGCTHFPFVKPAIQKTLGNTVNLVSPSYECVNEAIEVLKKSDLLNDKAADFNENKFYSTGALKDQYLQFIKTVFPNSDINVLKLDI